MTKNTTNSFSSIESFNKNYIAFWQHQVTAQVYNQMLGLLSEKIRHSMGEERSELQVRRKEIENKYNDEIKHIFPLLRKLATRDGEIAIECYETLKSASNAIVVNYTRLISANPGLRDVFLGLNWGD